jgi:hypothetical protein
MEPIKDTDPIYNGLTSIEWDEYELLLSQRMARQEVNEARLKELHDKIRR